MSTFIIVIPVHNDWACFYKLLKELAPIIAESAHRFEVIVIDDGSTATLADSEDYPEEIDLLDVVELATNLGHQRAIAIGLSIASKRPSDGTIVMDSDGEDRPEDLLRLLEAHKLNPNTIIVAERAKRSEPTLFKLSYAAYKLIFRLCTGKSIGHGNFCLIPQNRIDGLTHSAHSWNNLAASITRSRIPYLGIQTNRGVRYEGDTRMNFPALVLHGLSAVSVFLDIFAVRVVAACVTVLAVLSAASLGVVVIRVSTSLAIPGWTTNILGILVIVMLQIIILTVSILFVVLHNRSQPVIVPALVANNYIRSQRTIIRAGTNR